jgi:hypothetical protein
VTYDARIAVDVSCAIWNCQNSLQIKRRAVVLPYQ